MIEELCFCFISDQTGFKTVWERLLFYTAFIFFAGGILVLLINLAKTFP